MKRIMIIGGSEKLIEEFKCFQAVNQFTIIKMSDLEKTIIKESDVIIFAARMGTRLIKYIKALYIFNKIKAQKKYFLSSNCLDYISFKKLNSITKVTPYDIEKKFSEILLKKNKNIEIIRLPAIIDSKAWASRVVELSETIIISTTYKEIAKALLSNKEKIYPLCNLTYVNKTNEKLIKRVIFNDY